MTVLTWVATAIAIVGSILNSCKRIEGFFLWLISNSLYVYINIKLGVIAQAILFAFNILICIMGVVQWKKTK